jgi:DNA-binding SARP family transcriptional activator/Tfp pilus assembly protein PilF
LVAETAGTTFIRSRSSDMSNGPAGGPTARRAPRACIRTLGGLTLEITEGSGTTETEARALQELASRRRKVALLLYLTGQIRPVSRELLATLFWSEDEPARARHNLTEALSHIRRAFGRDAIASRVQNVQLADSCPLDVDVRLFDAALANGEMERAAALYSGPFLDGVFLDRALGFDDWVARERARWSGRFAALCATLVPRLLSEGRSAEAGALAEQWLGEDPEDADAAIGVLRALAAPGTRTALRDAIMRYRRLETRLRAEYESEPDDRVTALSATHVAKLAALPARREADSSRVTPIESAAITTDARPHTVPAVGTTTQVSSPRRFSGIFIALAAVLVTVAAWVALRPREAASSAPVLVLVADTEDPARDPVTAASITTVLRIALAQGDRLNVVTHGRMREVLRLLRRSDSTFVDEQTALEIATRTGAGWVVIPSLARFGAQRSLSTRTLEVATGRALGADQVTAVSDDSLLSALDLVAHQLRGRLGESAGKANAPRPLPDVTTASLGALRAYTIANDYSRRRVYDSAVIAYRRSIALDSSFATAYAALGQLLHYTNQPAEGERALERALSLRSRLTEREVMRNEATQARWRPQPDSAIAIQQRWLAGHPRDSETRSSMAYDLFLGRRFAAARQAYLEVLATDSLNPLDWINLAASGKALNTESDRAVARRAYARAFALDPSLRTDVIQNNEYGSLLVRAGFPDSAAAVFRLMLNGPPGRAARGYRSLGLLALWRRDPRTAVALFDSAARAHQAMKSEALGEVRARLMLAWARGEAGDEAGARAELERARALSRNGVAEPTVLYWAGKAMARRGMTDAAREMLDTLARRAVSGNVQHESAELLLRGELAVARGELGIAVPLMERGVALDTVDVPRESLAHALRAAGQSARADSLYRTLAGALRFGTEAMLAQQSAAKQIRPNAR